MNKITAEQIEQLVINVSERMAETVHQDYLNEIDSLPENVKGNPLAYSEVALAIAQRNSCIILKDVLIKLFAE